MLNIDGSNPEVRDEQSIEDQVLEIMSDTARLVNNLANGAEHIHYQQSRDELKDIMRPYFQEHPDNNDFLPHLPAEKNILRNWAIAARHDLVNEVRIEVETGKRDLELKKLIGGRILRVIENTDTLFNREFEGRVEHASSLLGSLTLRTAEDEAVVINLLNSDSPQPEDRYQPVASLKIID